jgi:uncharacterized protein
MTDKLDLHVSWDEYHRSIESLAEIISASGSEFDCLICIARGGLRVGDILSRIFDLPLAIIAAKSYQDRERAELTISAQIATTVDLTGKRILLIDDLVDSGVTLQKIVEHLTTEYQIDRHNIKTAVIWYKAQSVFQPDYYVSYLPDNPWIHQPFEGYDR